MKNILIIDDNPQNVNDFVEMVRRDKECIVEVNAALSDAERSIRLNKYDIIVIDIMMPTQGLSNIDELKTGLKFYKDKVEALIEAEKTEILFWSNLNNSTYNSFFGENPPRNTAFLHKDFKNENHLLEKINSMCNN